VANGILQTADSQIEQWKNLCASGHLYAVVDACDQPSVARMAAEAGPDRAVSLYRGSAEEQYASIAPYLFHTDEKTFDWIAGSLWKSPWGILVYCDTQLEALRAHLRRFITVKAPDQKKYLLRFYDPRILPPFLKSCNDAEVRDFFGPVRGFGATQGDAVRLLRLGS
jgi:hypothetical protein